MRKINTYASFSFKNQTVQSGAEWKVLYLTSLSHSPYLIQLHTFKHFFYFAASYYHTSETYVSSSTSCSSTLDSYLLRDDKFSSYFFIYPLLSFSSSSISVLLVVTYNSKAYA